MEERNNNRELREYLAKRCANYYGRKEILSSEIKQTQTFIIFFLREYSGKKIGEWYTIPESNSGKKRYIEP